MQQLEQLMQSYQTKRPVELVHQRTYSGSDLVSLSSTVLYGLLDNDSNPLLNSSNPLFDKLDIFDKKPLSPYEPPTKSFIEGLSSIQSIKSISSAPYSSAPKPLSSGPLTIRDFPSSGFQLHIHERPGGKPLLKSYSGEKITEINSYDAAVADLSANRLNIKKILKKYGIDIDD